MGVWSRIHRFRQRPFVISVIENSFILNFIDLKVLSPAISLMFT